jgi:hypothetical protein
MRENGSFNKGTESAVMQASLPIEVIPDVVTSPARKPPGERRSSNNSINLKPSQLLKL